MIVLLLLILVATTGCDRVLQVKIVIPPVLVPYYDWLIKYPGPNEHPEESPPERNWLEHNAWIMNNEAEYIKLVTCFKNEYIKILDRDCHATGKTPVARNDRHYEYL